MILAYTIVDIFAILLYLFKFSEETHYEKWEITHYSRIYEIIETIPAIIIQTILLLVPLKL